MQEILRDDRGNVCGGRRLQHRGPFSEFSPEPGRSLKPPQTRTSGRRTDRGTDGRTEKRRKLSCRRRQVLSDLEGGLLTGAAGLTHPSTRDSQRKQDFHTHGHTKGQRGGLRHVGPSREAGDTWGNRLSWVETPGWRPRTTKMLLPNAAQIRARIYQTAKSSFFGPK